MGSVTSYCLLHPKPLPGVVSLGNHGNIVKFYCTLFTEHCSNKKGHPQYRPEIGKEDSTSPSTLRGLKRITNQSSPQAVLRTNKYIKDDMDSLNPEFDLWQQKKIVGTDICPLSHTSRLH